MKTVRLTMAQAIVRYLIAQRTVIDGKEEPLFAGVFAIFGHGNVTCLGEALEQAQDALPTWRGQNEQSMALAAIAFAKAKRRRQMMVATSSIGPGATNMVTAAAVAHSNRLPVLLLSGDVFANRLPDPVLQQVEHFADPTLSVNDAFRAVTRYWDRITRPEQIIHSLPQAIAMMLDAGECGPAFLSLCQDVQAEAYDYPASFFEPVVHRVLRNRPDSERVREAAAVLKTGKKPLLIAGGGVHYSLATEALAAFAERHNIPVSETCAGRAVLRHDHPHNIGPIGVCGSTSANALAAEADVVLAVGTRLGDFTTGSWSAFAADVRIVTVNAARFDAHKHRALAVIGDARVSLEELSAALGDWRAPDAWLERGRGEYTAWNKNSGLSLRPDERGNSQLRAGDWCDQSRVRRERLGAYRGRRPARRDDQELACQSDGHVRLRIRLFLHGLRNRRRLGRENGEPGTRCYRLCRRRLLPDDELGHLQFRADGPQADHHRLRQWRVRGDRPAANGSGRALVQQLHRR